jgi:hypothetical protein
MDQQIAPAVGGKRGAAMWCPALLLNLITGREARFREEGRDGATTGCDVLRQEYTPTVRPDQSHTSCLQGSPGVIAHKS